MAVGWDGKNGSREKIFPPLSVARVWRCAPCDGTRRMAMSRNQHVFFGGVF